MKRVLFVIVDALATRIIEPAIQAGRLPTLAALSDRGAFHPRCLSIFPSITPAATAALITGQYPSANNIDGAFWYDPQTEDVAYFGDDILVVMNRGFGAYLRDFLLTLNYDRLRAETAYARFQQAGLKTAGINLMWFKAETEHEVNAPLLLKLLPGHPFDKPVHGPDILCLADFVSTHIDALGRPLEAPGGITRRYGFCDESSLAYFQDLASVDALPDFTCLYCPDNDFRSHAEGPAEAIGSIEEIDRVLGEVIAGYGGIDAFLEEFAFLMTGDHSQSDLDEGESIRSIRLDLVLAEFNLCEAGTSWDDQNELMICPNMRSAVIYFKPDTVDLQHRVVERLLNEPRVDQILERFPVADGFHYRVQTRTRGDLEFWPVTAPEVETRSAVKLDGTTQTVTDTFGGRWVVAGSPDAVGGTITNGLFESEDYPNPLERIANGFVEGPKQLWVTSVVGTEFQLPPTEVHNAGAHGSLHALDSTSPLIVAGLPAGLSDLPDPIRTIDVLPLCCTILGVDPPHQLGQPIA